MPKGIYQRQPRPKRLCSIEGCGRPHEAHGWCALHYDRWRNHGTTKKPVTRLATAEERFWSKVDKTGECWLWAAYVRPDGYGMFWLDGEMRFPHRVAYELTKGQIPDGLGIDHLCRVRHCVNPAHLEAVTNRENARRGLLFALKTHCPQGHPYDEENTYLYNGVRLCRSCRASNARRRRSH